MLHSGGKSSIGGAFPKVVLGDKIKDVVIAAAHKGGEAGAQGLKVKGMESWEMVFESNSNDVGHPAITANVMGKGEWMGHGEKAACGVLDAKFGAWEGERQGGGGMSSEGFKAGNMNNLGFATEEGVYLMFCLESAVTS